MSVCTDFFINRRLTSADPPLSPQCFMSVTSPEPDPAVPRAEFQLQQTIP